MSLRVGSLLSIRQDDVNLDGGMIYVRPETMKNRRGKKFKIGPDAITAVRAIWEPRWALLFEWPYRTEQLWAHFRRVQQAAGLPESVLSKSRFHKLRRSTATAVAAKAGIAQAASLLGHSSEEITRRYLDPTHMPHADATEFLEPLIGDDELLNLDGADVGLGAEAERRGGNGTS